MTKKGRLAGCRCRRADWFHERSGVERALQPLSGDRRGLDTEEVTGDGNGGYWLCDEYGPFLRSISTAKVKFSPNTAQRRRPAKQAVAGGLPNILKWRQLTAV